MNNPYEIDLGPELYLALWSDPNRPPNVTVAQWAQVLLKRDVRPAEEE